MSAPIGIIPQDPVILQRIRAAEISSLRRVCTALGANCLLDDPESHPYASLYVPLDGDPRRVYLDADRLDAEDAIVIASDVPAVAETT